MQTHRWPTQDDARAPGGHALTGRTHPHAEHRPSTRGGAVGHRHARRHACEASCPARASCTWTLSRPAAFARAEHWRCAPSPRAPALRAFPASTSQLTRGLGPGKAPARRLHVAPQAAGGVRACRGAVRAPRTNGSPDAPRRAEARGSASDRGRPALPAARRVGVRVGAGQSIRVPAGAAGPAAHGHARHGLACRAHTHRRVRHHSVSRPGSL